MVLGVRGSGFRLEHEEAGGGGRPRLVAVEGNARVVLTFPPQAMVEEKITARHVQFKVPAGTSMELSAEGVLEALSGVGKTVLSSGSGPADEATATTAVPYEMVGGPFE